MSLGLEEPIRYVPWYRKPVARQKPDDEHDSRRPLIASYLVLDLTIGRALANLGQSFERGLGSAGSGISVVVYVSLFFPIFFQWLRTQHYVNRFDAEDMVFTVHFLLNMMGMAGVGVSAGRCANTWLESFTVDGAEADCPIFASSLAGLRCLHVLFYLYAL